MRTLGIIVGIICVLLSCVFMILIPQVYGLDRFVSILVTVILLTSGIKILKKVS
jgi:Co/Zn/Cd efflux system component